MLLRRFMQHFKDQNWFAVGLDIIVVIVGIFLGMQVQQWYEERTEKERINAQIGSFRNELVLSLDLLNSRKEYYQARVASTDRLRELLENDQEISEGEFNQLVVSSIRGSSINVTFRGYQELTTTGAISKVLDTRLRDLIYAWDAQLTAIRNADASIENSRNTSIIPAALDSLAFGNSLQSDERYIDMTQTKRFPFDLADIRSNRGFDNALAIRQVQASQQLAFLIDFIEKTEAVIDAINRMESE